MKWNSKINYMVLSRNMTNILGLGENGYGVLSKVLPLPCKPVPGTCASVTSSVKLPDQNQSAPKFFSVVKFI